MAGSPQPSALTLGTAAFGMPYGISNPQKSPSTEKVEAMLDLAWAGGVTSFDTAPAYGESEQQLGHWLRSRRVTAYITTKLPSLKDVSDTDAPLAISAAIEQSTRRLGARPMAYLTHGAADYMRPAVRDVLNEEKARGNIGAAGASVYTEDEVLAVLEAGPPDAIQTPISAFDQRIASSGALDACSAAGIAVLARSVFLQGIMLMDPDRLPPAFEAFKPALIRFEVLCSRAGTTRLSFALRYVRDLPAITSTVVGAYTADQVKTLIAAATEPPIPQKQRAEIADITEDVARGLLDPRTWPKR